MQEQEFNGEEKRKHSRMNINFVVSYRIKEKDENFDLSQTKNISQGGMLLTTNKIFDKDTLLSMIMRFPLIPHKIEVTGVVVDSKEIVRDLIYETRLQFIDLDEDFFTKLGQFIRDNLKNG